MAGKSILSLLTLNLDKNLFRQGTMGANVQTLQAGVSVQGKYVIVGVPDERGVIANGGNPGAKEGPAAFRASFYKLYDTEVRPFNAITHHPDTPFDAASGHAEMLSQKFLEAGDIQLASTIEQTHENLAKVVEYFVSHGAAIVFVIGGGHDFSYGSYKGHVQARKNEIIPLINFDAHFDLRPVENGVINSGTAFYRILQDFPKNIADGKALLEIGIQRERNPHFLYQFAVQKNITTVEYLTLLNVWRDLKAGHLQLPLEHVRDHVDDCVELGFERASGSLHFSLCLDVFNQSVAPGTSASTPFGIQLNDMASSLSYFSRLHCCRVIDIAELCPARDRLDQTSRLTASLVYRIVLIREEYTAKE